jgi:hypothetical protein
MPEFGKNIVEVFNDTAARKQHAAQVRFSGQAPFSEPPRDVFLAGCQQIAEALAADGFTYARSGPRLTRKTRDFSFQIYFQSSPHNVRGELVVVWIHGNVCSKRLGEWLNTQPHSLRSNDGVAGGQIGNLLPTTSWMEWNLADPALRAATVSDAIATIRRIALPYFAQFDDVPAFCERLINDDIPSMSMPVPLEFLLCFSNRQRAEMCLHRFLCARPELLPQYHHELATLRRDGLPSAQRTGYAIQLAYATVAYELTPPGNA